MNNIKNHLMQRLLVGLLAVVFVPGLALAQEEPEQEADGRDRTVIIIDENGRMTVNGEEVETIPPSVRARLMSPWLGGRLSVAPNLVDFDLNLPVWPRLGLDDLEDRIEIQISNRAEAQEILRLERETRELARDLRRAEGSERQRLERDLRDRLNTLFDRKLAIREKRVQALQNELEDQREGLDKRRDAREDIIERRFRELTGERDEFDW